MIHEVIVTSINEDGSAHIAPMGVTHANKQVQIAPFKPSRTLDNLLRTETAVINRTADVSIFAGCITGRYHWPTIKATKMNGLRLAACLSHIEVKVKSLMDDELRPRFYCEILHEENHATFNGFNRAQAAVLEAAILVSRLDMLSHDKISAELQYLQIAIDKTAGEKELQAWTWLMEKIEQHRQKEAKTE